jgi:hypothetical protein
MQRCVCTEGFLPRKGPLTRSWAGASRREAGPIGPGERDGSPAVVEFCERLHQGLEGGDVRGASIGRGLGFQGSDAAHEADPDASGERGRVPDELDLAAVVRTAMPAQTLEPAAGQPVRDGLRFQVVGQECQKDGDVGRSSLVRSESMDLARRKPVPVGDPLDLAIGHKGGERARQDLGVDAEAASKGLEPDTCIGARKFVQDPAVPFAKGGKRGRRWFHDPFEGAR